MPKQTHGGDDDSESTETQETKIKLNKFELGPDKNIRDVFWAAIESWKEKKEMSEELQRLAYDQRFTFISIAKSIVDRNSAKKYGLTSAKLLEIILSIFLENDWKDAFVGMLVEFQEKEWLSKELLRALRSLLKREKEKEKMKTLFKELIRNANFYPIALFYISLLRDREMAAFVKNELIIFAKGDSLDNQVRAVDALSIIADEESARTIFSLLSNWDIEIRRAAAQALSRIGVSDDMIEKIKKQIEIETDEETRKILKRIVIRCKK